MSAQPTVVSVPVIAEEAKERIRGFVNAVEALQVTYGVTITADDSSLVIRDEKRTDEWVMSNGDSYVQWDAYFWGDVGITYPEVSLKQLVFEDFEGWDK